jgi:predicted TPR repeat methyltransferase
VDPGDAGAWSHRAIALADLGRPEAAVASHDRALEIDPGRAIDLFHRALALNLLLRHGEALRDIAAVLSLRPADGEAWFRHGQTLQLLGRHADALVSYEKALAADAGHAQAWSNRGGILRDARRLEEAAHCFEQAIAHGAEEPLHRYFLASVREEPPPGRAPGPYVQSLFDDYAPSFDDHLLHGLGYQAHVALADGLAGLGSRWYSQALDLGCGTGLCGPLFKPRVERLDGVDLSQAMLDKAATLGVYERLVRADVIEHLQSSEHRYDLVLAADVFIYIGDLDGVFEGVARVLAPDGVFCFSVELAAPERTFELRPSLRYAHGEPYLRSLAERHGFALRRSLARPIREEQGTAIDGLFLYLEKR